MQFFDTLKGSFYSAPLYQQARRAPGYGLGYSFLLVVLSTLFLVIGYTAILHREVFGSHNGEAPVFDDVVMQIANQIPLMTLQHDELQTKEPGKHVIVLRAQLFKHLFDGPIATIDTSGASTYQTMDTAVLITAHDVAVRTRKETKIESLGEVFSGKHPTLVINHALAVDMGTRMIAAVHANLYKIYLFFGLFCWIGAIAVLYVLRLFMLLALGLVGLLIGELLGSSLPYGTSVRLAGISYTPVTLISTLLLVATSHATGTLWLFIGGLAMLTAAIYITRETPLAEPV